MLRALLFAIAVAGQASAQESALQDPVAQAQVAPVPPPAEVCGVFFVDPDRMTYVPTPDYSLLSAATPLTAPPNQARVDALICDRPSMFIGPNDHRVLTDLHIPLFIRSGGRVGVMEFRQGQVHLRFSEGAPTDAERDAIAIALDRAQSDIDRIQAGTQ